MDDGNDFSVCVGGGGGGGGGGGEVDGVDGAIGNDGNGDHSDDVWVDSSGGVNDR